MSNQHYVYLYRDLAGKTSGLVGECVQWVSSDANFNYVDIKFTRESRHFWHGITEPGEMYRVTSARGTRPIATPNRAPN